MSVTKKIRYKNKNGTVADVDIGCNAVNVTQDTTHRFVTDAEKQTWNNSAYTHPAYTARTGVPTANQTPAFGGTFNVSQPVSDAKGHITGMNSRTITIPSAVATASKAGLMSASDKAKLDGMPSSSNEVDKYFSVRVDDANNNEAIRLDTSSGYPTLQMVSPKNGYIFGDVYLPDSIFGYSVMGQISIAPSVWDNGFMEYITIGDMPTHYFTCYNENQQSQQWGNLNSSGFRISTGSFISNGADYSEYWEWEDGNVNNEDRVGLFVTFTGNKIRLSRTDDDIRKVAVVSSVPIIIGDNDGGEWHKKYLKDIYGRPIYEELINKKGNLYKNRVINPEYDESLEYVERSDRPEWDYIGTHGKLVVRDDGTCTADGFCVPSDGGIATAAEDGFYVMERLDESHIRVYIR